MKEGTEKIISIYLILIAMLITLPYFLTRKTLPGYIIGGDTLVHAAIARGIYLGRNPFLDQTYNVYPSWYPFLYHLIVAVTSKVFQISIEGAMLLLQATLAILGCIVFFYVAKNLWGSTAGIMAMAFSLMFLPFHRYPNPKELIPIFGALFILYFVKERWVLSGIILGLGLWSHYASMFPLFVLPLTVYIFTRRKEVITPLLISTIVFLPFAINIISHADHIIPKVEDIYAFWKTDTLEKKLLSLLPPIYLVPFLLLSLYKFYKRRDYEGTVLFLSVVTIWGLRLLPESLKPFGIQIWSTRFTVPLPTIYLLLSAYGISEIKITSKDIKTIFLGILLFLIPIASALNFWEAIKRDPFIWVSEFELKEYFPEEHFIEVSEWIKANTERDNLIATSEEAGMMINALTGRPIMATLYGHGNTFLDNEIRRKDLELLFTADCKEKAKIISKYKIKYIVLDTFVYKRWEVKDMSCIAEPVYKVENVTILRVNLNITYTNKGEIRMNKKLFWLLLIAFVVNFSVIYGRKNPCWRKWRRYDNSHGHD
ncbi:transporter [Pyrococcus furiosus DSM 3638]|uniref:Transporter n=4 Tax=Thermococcaceae TaxID=2259 RepID=A0A5C0XN23_PYRFU|nr:hypothetical protein PFC_00195 [Pyrococcus furiosus COM1]QEK77951.1 transporter [Pyrococcus furiosus DSM 3638]